MKHILRQSLMKLLMLTLLMDIYTAMATNRHVGNGFPFSSISQAAALTMAGDTVTVHAGTYAGGWSSSLIKGNSNNWITLMAAKGEEVIFSGGTNAWQLTDAQYVKIQGFIFQGQTGNGVNFDDGGTPATPAHDIIFESCTFRNINATGNNDLLKLSGIDQFEIRNCNFTNGAAGGSGIDMVGCHEGNIQSCTFENLGSNAIQAKGGCKSIRIEGNKFKNAGQRAINIGGSTGLTFFRPIDATYEASEIWVYANIFIGSDAPVAFVGCINSEVHNNTFYLPTKWVLRILQETVDTSRFKPCGNNSFKNNIIFKNNMVSTDCNIGPNTAPQTFSFANNLWFNAQNPGWTGPSLPVSESNALISENPLFVNLLNEDFRLLKNSPAIGRGMILSNPKRDFSGNDYLNPPTIGAYEGGATSHVTDNDLFYNQMFIHNPVSEGKLIISKFNEPFHCEIINMSGQLIKQFPIESETTSLQLEPGIYFLKTSSRYYKILVTR